MAEHPWPLLRRLKQGDIETTALVDRDGSVVARISSPDSYPGDMRTAVENGDLTAEIASAAAAAPALYAALEMVRDADEDCKRDGLPTIPLLARARIDAALKIKGPH